MKKLAFIGVFILLSLSLQTAHASNYPDGCTATTAYSATTGHPCTLPDCNPGDLFSAVDGHKCTAAVYLPGCFSTVGYSTTTGTRCDGSTPVQSNPIITNPTNTMPDTTQPTTPDPVDNPQTSSTPAPLTQEQINNDITNPAAQIVRTKYPDAIFSNTWTMSNGKPGTIMVVSSTDPTVVLEFWNDNGKAVLHWIDTSLGSNQ
jgi:hypothetical protein